MILEKNFSGHSLNYLDICGYMEKYLIPNLDKHHNSSIFMSIIAMINFKSKSNIFFWEYFKVSENEEENHK
jgi:hypothetical protein